MPLRLAGGADDATGRVELQYDGEWGTVCGDNFGSEEARYWVNDKPCSVTLEYFAGEICCMYM